MNAIWQVQDSAANGSQATATDANTIKFSLNNVGSDNNMFQTDITLRNSTPENTNVLGDTNAIEDMGPDGIDIKIIGQFKNKKADIEKLVDWYFEDKFATGYEEGRFGLELDFPTRFNVEPTSTYGYQIVNPTMQILYEKTQIAGFTITLRLANPKEAIGP